MSKQHEDQIEFYSCPLCGQGTGNDVDGPVEHECKSPTDTPVKNGLIGEFAGFIPDKCVCKEKGAENCPLTMKTTASTWGEELKDLERITERGMWWVRIDRVEEVIHSVEKRAREEILKDVELKIGKWFDEEWDPNLDRLRLYGSPEGTRVYISQKNLVIEAVKEYLALTPQDITTKDESNQSK